MLQTGPAHRGTFLRGSADSRSVYKNWRPISISSCRGHIRRCGLAANGELQNAAMGHGIAAF